MTRDALAWRIRAFMDAHLAGTPVRELFTDLALDIHRWQRAHDPVVAALSVGPVDSWEQIPAVPVGLFKELPVGTVRRDEPCVVFRTSGTTGGGRGEHRLRDTSLYDAGSAAWARVCVPDAPTDVVALLDDPGLVPDSSLSHMVGLFGPATWHVHNGNLDAEGLRERLDGVRDPVYVAATAFALAEWLEDHQPEPLPEGSVLMITGGFKGRLHRLDDDALYNAARGVLQPARLVTEYGMTELSSQLWGTPASPYRPPPWLRVVAADPVTGQPLPDGQPGQLRFVDLCNLDGTVAIETLDEGLVLDDGSLRLFGRLEGAPARGCSLTVEEAWAR